MAQIKNGYATQLREFNKSGLKLSMVQTADSLYDNLNLEHELSDEEFDKACYFLYNAWAICNLSIPMDLIACHIAQYLKEHSVDDLLKESYFDDRWSEY